MNKPIIRIYIFLILLGGVIGACCSCSFLTVAEKYDKEWIIGKTSSEIESQYGAFDIWLYEQKNEMGNYYNTSCGYLTKKGKSSLASAEDEFLVICFDEDGIAYKIKENYPRPGG